MGLGEMFRQCLMSSVAKRSICRLLAVAQLIIPAFIHIKYNRSVPRELKMAFMVAEWLTPACPAGAPLINLSLFQKYIDGNKPRANWQCGGPVLAFRVVVVLRNLYYFLHREVRNVCRLQFLAGGGRVKDLGPGD